MASRKQQKEEARQRRLEQERAQAAQAAKRRRMQMLGGVLAAAVAVVAVAIAISAGGSGATGLQHGHKATQTATAVNAALQGIPQSGTTLGNPNAKLTMYYYGDLECPDCMAFTLGEAGGGLPQFISKDVRQGKVKLIYKSFCTATCTHHPASVFDQQQVAAYAAGQQHMFWNYAELFYHEQGDETTSYVTTGYLDGLAKQLTGLNLSAWQADQKNPSFLSQVQQDERQGTQLGLGGTPTLIAQGPKGETEVGAGASGLPTYQTMESALQKVA